MASAMKCDQCGKFVTGNLPIEVARGLGVAGDYCSPECLRDRAQQRVDKRLTQSGNLVS